MDQSWKLYTKQKKAITKDIFMIPLNKLSRIGKSIKTDSRLVIA